MVAFSYPNFFLRPSPALAWHVSPLHPGIRERLDWVRTFFGKPSKSRPHKDNKTVIVVTMHLLYKRLETNSLGYGEYCNPVFWQSA